MNIRVALRPNHRIALVLARTLLTGFQALSFGSHHFVGALDLSLALRQEVPLPSPSRSSGRDRPIVVLASSSLSDLTPHSLILLGFSSFLINKKCNNISMLRVS